MRTGTTYGLLFIGGNAPPLQQAAPYFPKSALTIAADSGLHTAFMASIIPDIVIGDMDSVHPLELAAVDPNRIRTFPRDKNFSDTELAVRLFYERGIETICMVGGGGGRLDHLLALREIFLTPYAPAYWITDCNISFLLNSRYPSFSAHGVSPTDPVSIFPLHHTSHSRIHDVGLQWPLMPFFSQGGTHSLSNRALHGKFEVTCSQAVCLIVLPLKENLHVHQSHAQDS